MGRLKLNQSGAVSMLSVMIFSIIITVLATAYIRSVTSQQQNALSYDQATRAYYAAEAGAQDALRQIKLNPSLLDSPKEDCAPYGLPAGTSEAPVGYNAEFGLSYTCQLVRGDTSEVSGTVQPGGALNAVVRLELRDSPPPSGQYDLIVRWSEQTPYDSSKTPLERDKSALHPRTQTTPLLPKNNHWTADDPNKNVHALLRVAVISHPITNFSRTSIKQKLLYLNPISSTGSMATLDGNSDSIETQQSQLFTNTRCYRSDSVTGADYGTYSCRATLRLINYNLATQAVYVRVGSVYNSTKYSLELRAAGGSTSLNLKNAQATIDVTGKAGNSFRRVQQKVPLKNNYEDRQPDAALLSAEGICKLFSIGSTAASYSSGCNPLID